MTAEEKNHSWNVTKEKLIREIMATYEAILKFREYQTKSSDELNALSMDDLSTELHNQSGVLDELIKNWDIKK